MSECYHQRFLLNQQVKGTCDFDPDLIFRGESLYEVIRIIENIPLFISDHMTRLYRTSRITGMDIWYDEKDIKSALQELIRINGIRDGNIKLVFNFFEREQSVERNFLAYFIEPLYPATEQYNTGVPCILFHASRNNPTAKVINRNLRLAVYKKLIEKSAYEALLVDKKGEITEGSRSNLFFIINEVVYTAPDSEVLSGIARKYVLELCKKENIPLLFEKISQARLPSVNAVFITGTSSRVLPVSRTDHLIFDPKNQLLRRIMAGYDEIIRQYIRAKQESDWK